MTDPSYSLLAQLMEYQKHSIVPMHMPGHKRNTQSAPYLAALGAPYDITEIEGFDNLHHPGGILKHGMERAARLWGCDHSFFWSAAALVAFWQAFEPPHNMATRFYWVAIATSLSITPSRFAGCAPIFCCRLWMTPSASLALFPQSRWPRH